MKLLTIFGLVSLLWSPTMAVPISGSDTSSGRDGAVIMKEIGPCDREGLFITEEYGGRRATYQNCYSYSVTVTPKFRDVGSSTWTKVPCVHANPGQKFTVFAKPGLINQEFSYSWGCE